MSAPDHYSRDIAVRCQNLIQHLLPMINDGLPDDERFAGPLRTTFLLAMATPMIVLPIERLFKPGNPNAAQAGDDTELDPALANEVADILGETRTFGEAPFAANMSWRYVQGCPPFNVAADWPHELLDRLDTPEAIDAARKAPASRILLNLRNALAHGGVAYLDENGRNTRGRAAMFAFAATQTRNRQIAGLNILRIHEDEFGAFLAAWTQWLARTPVPNVLSHQSAVAA